jgi:threonyl-tRNA synthetase
VWLAPVQAVAVPVAEEYADYLGDVVAQMKAAGIRADLDASDDRMQKKIRNHTVAKVPYIVIAGEEDRANNAVSFRYRNGEQENGIPVADAIARIVDAIRSRATDLA